MMNVGEEEMAIEQEEKMTRGGVGGWRRGGYDERRRGGDKTREN